MTLLQILFYVLFAIPLVGLVCFQLVSSYIYDMKERKKESVDRADIAESLKIIAQNLSEPKYIRLEKNDDNDYDIIL